MSSQTGNSPLTEYTYDPAGNILTMRVGGATNAAVTTFTYNNRGQLTQTTDALGQTESMTYDNNGNLLTRNDRNGTLFRMTYDNMGRLVREEAVQSGVVTGYVRHSFTATGALRYQNNGSHWITNYYDAQGRVIRQNESNSISRTFAYNTANNVTESRVYIGSSRYMHNMYTFDAAQRVRSVTSNGQLMSTYTFNANGARTSAVFGNGTRTDYTRNLAGLATRVEHRHGDTVLSRFDNSYHLDGNIQQVIETMSGETRTITYTYDTARRLVREQDAGFRTLDRQYTFDNRGNRTRMTVTGDEAYEVTYTYDLNNRLLTETRTGDNPSTNTFTYDRNGNQLTRVTMGVTETHTYNAFNRLVQVTNPSTTVTYTYRADGLRRNKTINGTATTHVWMGSHVVLERRGDSGTVINRFHRSASGRLIRSEHHGWYLHNVRGDVTQRVDDAGVVLRNYRYTAFGVELDQAEGNTNPHRWAGMYWDWATSTYMTPNRHFSPRLGRWSQPDPFWNTGNMQRGSLAIQQSSNLFMFTMHNPIRWRDPTGLFAIPAITPPIPQVVLNNEIMQAITQAAGNLSSNVSSTPSSSSSANFILCDPILRFQTMNDAAVSWGLIFHPLSKPTQEFPRGSEWGAWIYRDPLGYFFGEPWTDRGEYSVRPPDNARDDPRRIAAIHTHPNSDFHRLNPMNELFSGRIAVRDGDGPFVLRQDVPLFLVTPAGALRRLDPSWSGYQSRAGAIPNDSPYVTTIYDNIFTRTRR